MSKETELIVKMIEDMRDEQREHAKNSASHREETIKWQVQTDARTERIEHDLREHKEGVIQNRGAIKVFDERLDLLEKPGEAKKYLYKKYMKVGGVISITLTIMVAAAKLAGLF